MKKFFSPKGWLIANGLIHGAMGCIVQLTMTDNAVEMSWGEAATAHDAMYEAIMGFMVLPPVVLMWVAAFALVGKAQAQVSAALGASLTLAFLGIAAVSSGTGYMADMGTFDAFAPPMILSLGMLVSGMLHMNEAAS